MYRHIYVVEKFFLVMMQWPGQHTVIDATVQINLSSTRRNFLDQSLWYTTWNGPLAVASNAYPLGRTQSLYSLSIGLTQILHSICSSLGQHPFHLCYFQYNCMLCKIIIWPKFRQWYDCMPRCTRIPLHWHWMRPHCRRHCVFAPTYVKTVALNIASFYILE